MWTPLNYSLCLKRGSKDVLITFESKMYLGHLNNEIIHIKQVCALIDRVFCVLQSDNKTHPAQTDTVGNYNMWH